jgi:hypothetical protein
LYNYWQVETLTEDANEWPMEKNLKDAKGQSLPLLQHGVVISIEMKMIYGKKRTLQKKIKNLSPPLSLLVLRNLIS